MLEAADYDVSDERESLRLFQGLLTWRATEEFPIKKWEYAKQITEIESMVKDTQDKLVRLEALSADRLRCGFFPTAWLKWAVVSTNNQDVLIRH